MLSAWLTAGYRTTQTHTCSCACAAHDAHSCGQQSTTRMYGPHGPPMPAAGSASKALSHRWISKVPHLALCCSQSLAAGCNQSSVATHSCREDFIHKFPVVLSTQVKHWPHPRFQPACATLHGKALALAPKCTCCWGSRRLQPVRSAKGRSAACRFIWLQHAREAAVLCWRRTVETLHSDGPSLQGSCLMRVRANK
jgi:hypothetical protein